MYSLKPGYAFRFSTDDEFNPDAPDEQWETVVVGETELAMVPQFVRLRKIDGAACAVFRLATSTGSTYFAQLAQFCRADVQTV